MRSPRAIGNRYGVKVLDSGGCYPGGQGISAHYDDEKSRLDDVLDNIEGPAPVMVEIGSYWALWSLLFRNKFPDGINILVEMFAEKLQVGIDNFCLNGFTDNVYAYHGGVSLSESGSIHDAGTMGPEVTLGQLMEAANVSKLDFVHCDIQGSELEFLKAHTDIFEQKRILHIVVGTHPHISENKQIHEDVIEFLESNGYEIVCEYPRTTDDGYVYARATQ